MIYVCRNPKDVAISFFRHFCIFNNYSGTEEEFLEAFIEDKGIESLNNIKEKDVHFTLTCI